MKESDLAMDIFRVVTEWSGFRGGPGYTNFFFRNLLPGGAPTTVDDRASAAGARERVAAFWTQLVPFIPNDVSFTVSTVVDVLEDTTGELQASYVMDSIPKVTGLSDDPYSGASGAVIGWQTGAIRRGRRIRGRTFIVPLAGDQYGPDGRLDPYIVRQLQQYGETLAIGGINSTFGVWARPSTSGSSDGQWAEASGVRVSDLPAILRSRRD